MLTPVVKGSKYAAALGGIAAALGACEPQASPEYWGQSLLTVHGSVEISDDRTEGDLAPALAFMNRTGNKVQILEVGVQGRFPSDFRLDVYSPPSDELLVQLQDFGDGEPRVAVAYITAVTEDHPDVFEFATETIVTAAPTRCDDSGCEPGPEQGETSDSESPWRFFAGFSNNYAVAYLKDPARAGSGTATILGSPDGMPRGYHLLKSPEYAADLQEEYHDCTRRGQERAIARYNDANGTEYTNADLRVELCGLGPGPLCTEDGCEELQKPSICEHSSDEQDRFLESVRVEGVRAELELGCLVAQFETVRDPERAEIAIEITPDAAPAFGPNQEPVF